MASYKIRITMDSTTVDTLQKMGMRLYAFKAVQASTDTGSPLVWFSTDTYSVNTEVTWEVSYQAYSSQNSIVPGGVVTASAPYDIDLGETFTIQNPSGTGSVTKTGEPVAITIYNNVPSEFTCGISQKVDSGVSPLCAFPIYNGMTELFVPVEKVLLMFATTPVNTGTVIIQAYAPGMIVELTGVSEREVSYDLDTLWSWGGASWGTPVDNGEDLVPLLIEPTDALVHLARAANANVALPAGV